MPVLFTFSDTNYTEISNQLIEYFNKLNIEVQKKEPTEKINKLLKKYDIEPFEIRANALNFHLI